jgi:hypothetical protein
MLMVYSFIAGLVCINRFAAPVEKESKNRLYKRLFVVDGESSMIVGLRAIMGV